MRHEGKQRWGDKTPQYVTEIPILAEIFPDCKIIHIYRDGRDVALSWLQRWHGPANVYGAAVLWKEWVRAGRRAGSTLSPGTYHEVAYEALLANPEQILRRLCDFLEEAFHPDMLRPSSIGLKTSKPLIGEWTPGNVSKVELVVSNTHKWRDRMPPADRALFESIAGDLLAELGYEVEGRTRDIAWHEVLRWRAHNRVRHYVQKVNMRVRMPGALPSALLVSQAALRTRLKKLGAGTEMPEEA